MTANETEETTVVFRKWKDGGTVIALFPYQKGDTTGRYCDSYEHVGQHGNADYCGVLAVTVPATEEEAKPLKKELESIGYRLKVQSRISRRRIASC